MDAYLRLPESEGRAAHSIRDTRYRDAAFIRPTLGNTKIVNVTADILRHWRDELVRVPPRLRTSKHAAQRHHRPTESRDAQRARRATANRTWTILRAALNHAFQDGKVESDLAWRKVRPFKNVDAARIRYLTVAEAKRLINASAPEFRLLVQAALQTGCRFGELARLTVSDFNPDAGTVAIRQSKTGRARHVVLTDEGARFFREACAGRLGSEPMLIKDNGTSWDKSHQGRCIAEAVKRAKITPTINFHGLRHTWASLAVMAGVPIMVVARNLGHVDPRMVEKHFGHLAPSYISEAIRKGAPRFGFKPTRAVVPIR